jgi:hypothetical protein
MNTITKKINRKTRKSNKLNRRTRKTITTVNCGGALATNIVRGITTDKELSKNYHETLIKVENTDYVVRYIVPDHFLFKTPDQVFKNPEFEAILSGKKVPKCLFTIEDSGSKSNVPVYVTMFVKVQSIKNPKAFYWFAVTDSGTQVMKTGELFNYLFFSIKAKNFQISNNNSNVISIKNSKMYKTKDCSGDKCTVVLVNGKNGAVEVLNKKSVYQTILFNFFVQQQAQEFAKEEAVIGAAVVGAEAAGVDDDYTFDLF